MTNERMQKYAELIQTNCRSRSEREMMGMIVEDLNTLLSKPKPGPKPKSPTPKKGANTE